MFNQLTYHVCQIGLNINGAFLGAVRPVRATSFHILLTRWANIVSDRFYPISHRSSFQSLVFAIHPGATIKHNLHLIYFMLLLRIVAILFWYARASQKRLHDITTIDDVQTFCELRNVDAYILHG